MVAGGGYGGLRAVEFLVKHKDIHVTLIDMHPYHYLQTEAYGYIAGRFDLHDVVIDIKDWCEGFGGGVEFVNETLRSIDFDSREVLTCNKSVPYDFLVIAVGAKTNFFSFIKGLREHSFGVKSLRRAHKFRVEFEDLIYKKLYQENLGDINLVVGGAGLSGVEVAAEMANVLEEYKKTIGEGVRSIKIYLVDASSAILPGMSRFLVESTHRRLEALGVRILTDAFIDELDDTYIYFKNKDKLQYHFMIFTGGIKASGINEGIDVAKNKLGQFMTDEYLHVGNSGRVFAVGDCVEIRDKSARILPPTAQTAESSAEYVAKNIRGLIDGKTLKPYEGRVLGVFIALGGKWASGELFGFIKVKGYTAYLLKKAITYAYYLGLKLRINTGFKNRIKR